MVLCTEWMVQVGEFNLLKYHVFHRKTAHKQYKNILIAYLEVNISTRHKVVGI